MNEGSTTAPQAPYPADTRAKGWRFELDYEAIQQSDTWDLAAEVPMAQPALLMMWLCAWVQNPCGSLPADETLIRAKCKISPQDWPRMRDILMRGWWLASDGRLYHPTLTQRVLEMMAKRDGEKNRKAEYRRRKDAEAKLAAANGQRFTVIGDDGFDEYDMSHGTDVDMSHGTDGGQDWDGPWKDNTRTRTSTGLDSSNPPPRASGEDFLSHGTGAGRICRLMKAEGVSDVNPSSQALITLINAGAADGEFQAAARSAVKAKAGFSYALTIVANERKRAAALAQQVLHGAMPAAAFAQKSGRRAPAPENFQPADYVGGML